MSRSRWTKTLAAIVGVVFLFLVLLGIYWSPMPKLFWVNEYVEDQRSVVGYSTTDTLIRVAETLLDKRGGYLSNDLMPPGVWLDNMPNWEYGVLTQVRDLARVTRNDYSRSQSQSAEDPDLAVSEPKFFFDSDSWILPRTEAEYRDAIEGFMGSMSRRLGNSVAADVINEGLAGDPVAEAAQSQPDTIAVRTPWLELDDVFFESRGTAWALLHFFRAVEFDFSEVLADKNAEASVRQIIRELEASLEPMRWPVVLNGGGYGLTANHSLVMANYLARANAAVINLRELLDQG